MLKIAICDDEGIIVEYIERLILENIKVKESAKIYKYTEPQKIQYDIKNRILQDIDILYIDIKIKGVNGIEIAEQMQRENPKLKIIYMTAYCQYSEEIFRTRPTYLLLKPIKQTKFKESFRQAMIQIRGSDRVKTFKVKGKIFNIKINNIKYIESNKRIAIIYEEDIKREIYAKLSELEEILPKQFVRCHQSYIINLDKVRELNTHEFILDTGESIPISQLKYKEAKNSFIEYLGDVI